MEIAALKVLIQNELPNLLREDPALRDYILQITRQSYADKQETEGRFERMLEETSKHFDRLHEEYRLEREKQERKWEESGKRFDQALEEFRLEREKQDRKWENLQLQIVAQAKKFDRSIGGLGARWGLQSEAAFRNALAGILEENFGVEVVNVNEYDDSGEVFGRPEQVELDIIIKNGLLLICELKSSIDKAGMYIFERKARFYEKHHQRRADSLLVISPMVDPKATKVAKALGIRIYSDSSEVESLEGE